MKIHSTSDWIIALVVVICSLILLLALASALSGAFLGKPDRSLEVDFPDITGVGVHSQVRYAGAPAGVVTHVRILTPAERLKSPVPNATVRVTISLRENVPPLLQNTVASIASETILSEKFIQLTSSDPSSPELATGQIIPGISPVTLDEFLRKADRIVTAAGQLLGGEGATSTLLQNLQATVSEAKLLLAEGRAAVSEMRALIGDMAPIPGEVRPVLGDFRGVAKNAGGLMEEARPRLERALANLESASRSLDRLATTGANFVSTHETSAAALLADLRLTMQNSKIATTWFKIWIASLARRPNQLIWGNRRPPELPSEKEILASPEPLPIAR